MRLLLKIALTGSNNILPMNYQYEFSSWIYSRIYASDSDFSQWLHDNGYVLGGRKFKFFTFSNLRIQRYQVKGDRLLIESAPLFFEISFLVDKTLEHFVIGLFQNQVFTIGDKHSKAECCVSSVEILPEPMFTGRMEFHSLSPICVSRYRADSTNKNAEYLSPKDDVYENLFFDNLMRKYIAIKNNQVPVGTEVSDLSEESGIAAPMKLEVLSEPKSRLIRIKAYTPEQSFVRGYEYCFRLTAPVELMRLGYYAGFGEKNSVGFGCVGVEKKTKE